MDAEVRPDLLMSNALEPVLIRLAAWADCADAWSTSAFVEEGAVRLGVSRMKEEGAVSA